jgi:hypothetical protein
MSTDRCPAWPLTKKVLSCISSARFSACCPLGREAIRSCCSVRRRSMFTNYRTTSVLPQRDLTWARPNEENLHDGWHVRTRPTSTHEGIMMKRITKSIVATGAIIAASLLAVAAPSAIADTSTLGMGCYVDSSRLDMLRADYCGASEPATQHTVWFEVTGRSAGGYAYNWSSASAEPTTIVSGCTPSSRYCVFKIGSRRDWSLTTSAVVTESATGASKTVTAVAEGMAVCGGWRGVPLHWC